VVLTFSALENELPAVMTDNEGTKWDLFGNGLSGPRSGQKLKFVNSYIAFWFAWAAFYPNTEIHTF
ncbi:MAG: DUF3179 domain-containing protein, partial [Aliifodinibius sp.]|nr:DUF3179 domain-containing protein [Fodinibius sp.]